MQHGAGRFDTLHGGLHGRRRRAAFRSERHQCRGVAQVRAIILAIEPVLRLRIDHGKRHRVDPLRARAIADQRQRRRHLGLGNRRRQRIEF